jgi:outer membrane lipoprotein carrier protein
VTRKKAAPRLIRRRRPAESRLFRLRLEVPQRTRRGLNGLRYVLRVGVSGPGGRQTGPDRDLGLPRGVQARGSDGTGDRQAPVQRPCCSPQQHSLSAFIMKTAAKFHRMVLGAVLFYINHLSCGKTRGNGAGPIRENPLAVRPRQPGAHFQNEPKLASRTNPNPRDVHDSSLSNVSVYVTLRVLSALLVLTPLFAADIDVPKTLKNIEKRYNSAKTIEVRFQETYHSQGRTRTESGDLFLRKPGRMRWQYTEPKGKLFVSDGKSVYFYSPDTNRAEKMKLKETEDMRAPMAFLLGRLDFDKDFGRYLARPEGGSVFITATPKSDKLPYREVSFVVAPDARIERLMVTGQDSTVLDFVFSGEKINPPINDQMFRFQVPKGAEFVDSSETPQGASE